MLAQYGPRQPQALQEFVAEFWDPDADYYPVRKFPDAHARHGVREIAEAYDPQRGWSEQLASGALLVDEDGTISE
jgi:hypothetical protein